MSSIALLLIIVYFERYIVDSRENLSVKSEYSGKIVIRVLLTFNKTIYALQKR